MEKSRVSESSSSSSSIDPKPPITKTTSFNHSAHQTLNSPLTANDRRYAYARQSSLQHSGEPRSPTIISNNFSRISSSSSSNNNGGGSNNSQSLFSRSVSSIDIPPTSYAGNGSDYGVWKDCGISPAVAEEKLTSIEVVSSVLRVLRSGNRPMKRLFVLISLNVAYSTAELFIGLLSGRAGLVSDAFHLTFGCGLLTFSLFAMAISRRKPDRVYTYGESGICLALVSVGQLHTILARFPLKVALSIWYKRLEVLSAFTNALFLLFMSFSLAVEALHTFIQDESEHKHYLVVSAVTNLVVNLVGVWFFRNYARMNLAYRNAEDMNYHSVCLHVISDSIRSAGLILASWLLALGIRNAEVLCLGLVSVTVFMLVMPLFKATGGVLLQMAPPNIPSSAMSKCYRQIAAIEDVAELSDVRLWELVPGHAVGSVSLQVKAGIDDKPVLQFLHGLYHDLGIHDLTVQIDDI